MTIKHALLAGSAGFLLTAMPAMAQSLGEDGDVVTLTGIVNSVDDDEFTLDYGAGLIEVEFEDGLFGDPDLDEQLVPGERVTVYGEVDDELFGGQEIEAETIFVRSRATVYGGDPALASVYYVDPYPVAEPTATFIALEGEVTDISGREFTLMTGQTPISVDTMGMADNPLDDRGQQRVERGDRVMVVGQIDVGVFDEAELSADLVYSMRDDASGRMAAQQTRQRQESMAGPQNAMRDQNRDQNRDRRQERAGDPSAPNAGMMASGQEGDDSFKEFDRIDTNDDGVITEREYVRSVSRVANIDRDEAREMFGAIARDDEEITRREFIRPSQEVQDVIEEALKSGG